MKNFVVILSLLCGGCQLSVLPPKSPPPFGGIVHYDIVDQKHNISRGGQPTTEGFKYLKSIGIETILKLNQDSEGSDAEAAINGMLIIKVPISFSQQMFGKVPTQAIEDTFLRYHSNIYIHCEHGEDRTGLACYLLRRQQGWTKEQAEQEMFSHGFHKILHALWEAVEDQP